MHVPLEDSRLAGMQSAYRDSVCYWEGNWQASARFIFWQVEAQSDTACGQPSAAAEEAAELLPKLQSKQDQATT
jgi:hypothetical protein